MSFGIYKMGQGYWVRVLSAVGVGILGLAAAAWGWGQGGAVRLPVKSYTYNVTAVQGSVSEGETVQIIAPTRADSGEESAVVSAPVGTGIVLAFSSDGLSGGQLEVGAFSSDQTRDLAFDAESITSDTGFSAAVRQGGVTANPIFPPIYLQAGIAGALMILTAIGIFWFVGFGRRPVEFLIAVDGEMKKVHWTTAREIRGSTIVVIVAAFLIAGLLFGVDIVFKWFFGAIDVLQA